VATLSAVAVAGAGAVAGIGAGAGADQMMVVHMGLRLIEVFKVAATSTANMVELQGLEDSNCDPTSALHSVVWPCCMTEAHCWKQCIQASSSDCRWGSTLLYSKALLGFGEVSAPYSLWRL